MRRLPKIQDNIKLDIGCGAFKREGYTGMDWQDFGQEIIWNINEGIPLPNDSVEEVYSSHFIEHLKEDEIYNFIVEVRRVCKSGAKVQLIVPHADTQEAYYICHYTRWNELRMEGICSEFENIKLVDMSVEGIHFKTNIIINK